MKLPDYFEFSCMSKTSSGRKALDHLPFELRSLNAKKPLVITDNNVCKNGLEKKIINGFKSSQMTIGLYTGITPQSDINTVKELAGLYKDGGFDAIIAAGSGIVVDIAKILNIAISGNDANITSCLGENNIPYPLRPLIYVAVSAGTGKESSCEASLGDFFYSSRYLMPDVSVTDPEMLIEEKPERVINTALQALTIALEASVSKESNPLRKPYSYACIQQIMDNLEPVVENALTQTSRLKSMFSVHCVRNKRVALASAVSMGGFVYSNAPCGPAYLIGNEVSQITGVPAGLCMAAVLPAALEYADQASEESHDRILMAIAGIHSYCGTPHGQRFASGVTRVREMLNRFFMQTSGDIPRTLKDTGLNENRLKEIAKKTAGHKAINIDEADILKIIKHAFSGTPAGTV